MFHSWEKVEKSQVLRLLKQLQDFFSDPKKWIFWPIATTEDDIEISPLDVKAAKFSLMGACEYLLNQEYKIPEIYFIDCATRDYLNDLSNDDLIHGKCKYEDEMLLIKVAIEGLSIE